MKIFTVPCFSGAPWDSSLYKPFMNYNVETTRLPEDFDQIEKYVDYIINQIKRINEDVILVGDSFGANITLGVAIRKPENLKAIIVSGGFAANPIRSPFIKKIADMIVFIAKYTPSFIYKNVTLRIHAKLLASKYDKEGDNPMTPNDIRDLFVINTPASSYAARAKAALSSNLLDKLSTIDIPTLILTPEDDHLIGANASKEILERIKNSKEIILLKTGHMFRFTHPTLYSQTVVNFINEYYE
jgi:pimeloyl-ACP methyl ester carboxylesterase